MYAEHKRIERTTLAPKGAVLSANQVVIASDQNEKAELIFSMSPWQRLKGISEDERVKICATLIEQDLLLPANTPWGVGETMIVGSGSDVRLKIFSRLNSAELAEASVNNNGTKKVLRELGHGVPPKPKMVGDSARENELIRNRTRKIRSPQK